ncbi:hypothetical protein [Parvibaculum sp.]|uniref:hypothetical protein n=1 Tax=Parvibaculum sp. TaxID=2024848 RepID=UPI00272C5C69|nr:hypothetical protein [Parvibaculum sp.]
MGALLAVIAVPRIAGHAALLPYGSVRAALDEGVAVEAARLDAAREALERAGEWLPGDAAIARDRARVARRVAVLAGDGRAADGLRLSAVADLRIAAASAPADAFNWALLADAEIIAGTPIEAVLPALRLARLTGPRKASALLLQHGIVMRHWPAMPDEMRIHVMRDAAVFWHRPVSHPFVLESYYDAGYAARAAFRAELAAYPRSLEHLDLVLLRNMRRR